MLKLHTKLRGAETQPAHRVGENHFGRRKPTLLRMQALLGTLRNRAEDSVWTLGESLYDTDDDRPFTH